MASVHDVAAYILERTGRTTAMKLQKLVYYSQAWHAVWDEERLFDSQIQAWRNGPVSPDLYAQHRGRFEIDGLSLGDSHQLTQSQKATIDAIVSSYGELSAQQLSELTHAEDPWRNARVGCDPAEISNSEISVESMVEYYGSLGSDAVDVAPPE
jgi:uncharacterized phage-associated protein